MKCKTFSQNLVLNKQKPLLGMLYLICQYLMAFTLNIYGLLSKNKYTVSWTHYFSEKYWQSSPSVTEHSKISRKKGKMKKYACILQLLTDYITGDMIFVDYPDM